MILGGLRVLGEASDVAAAAAASMLAVLTDACRDRGGASLGLAGGSTPRAAYRALARSGGVPWEKVELWFGDERCVPPEDPQSNYRMVREALFGAIEGTLPRAYRIRGEEQDLEAEAERYGDSLPERLDLLLLGVGADGHTASLFPGDGAIEERERRVRLVEGPKPPSPRFTITPPVIADARAILVIATGEEKADAVARALVERYEPRETPIQLARRGTFLLDRAAASALPESLRGRPEDA